MYMSMKIFEEAGGDAVDPSVKMLFVVLICAMCIGLLVAGALAMAINLRAAHSTFADMRQKRMKEEALDNKGGEEDQESDGEERWGKEKEYRKRHSQRENIRKGLSRTAVVPYSESDISKMSPAMMEDELRRLMVMQKGILSPRQAEATMHPSELRKWGKSPPKETNKKEVENDGDGEDIAYSMNAADDDDVDEGEEEVDGEQVVDLTEDNNPGLQLMRQSVEV
jgi:hypothetical protein